MYHVSVLNVNGVKQKKEEIPKTSGCIGLMARGDGLEGDRFVPVTMKGVLTSTSMHRPHDFEDTLDCRCTPSCTCFPSQKVYKALVDAQFLKLTTPSSNLTTHPSIKFTQQSPLHLLLTNLQHFNSATYIPNMYSITLALTTLLSLAAAAAVATPLEVRDNDAHTNMYASDVCQGAVDAFDVVGSGGYRCVAVSNKRSISASGTYVFAFLLLLFVLPLPLLPLEDCMER